MATNLKLHNCFRTPTGRTLVRRWHPCRLSVQSQCWRTVKPQRQAGRAARLSHTRTGSASFIPTKKAAELGQQGGRRDRHTYETPPQQVAAAESAGDVKGCWRKAWRRSVQERCIPNSGRPWRRSGPHCYGSSRLPSSSSGSNDWSIRNLKNRLSKLEQTKRQLPDLIMGPMGAAVLLTAGSTNPAIQHKRIPGFSRQLPVLLPIFAKQRIAELHGSTLLIQNMSAIQKLAGA